MRIAGVTAGIGAATFLAGAAWAEDALERVGKPVPGGMNFQPAATEVMRGIHFLDSFLTIIIVAITLFVTALLAIVIFRFNAKANPTPATFTHNSTIEVAWTVIPIIILIVIGSISLPQLFRELEIPKSDLTIKVTGNQWFWSYEYPDQKVGFDAQMLQKDQLEAAGYKPDEYLLATDNAVVVPLNAVVRLQITGADVIHSWAMPAFGVKLDAVPGRLQETWFKADVPGIYFGQCSELCGKDHAYMPIVVKVLPQDQYDAWLAKAQQEMSTASAAEPITLAAN